MENNLTNKEIKILKKWNEEYYIREQQTRLK